MTNSNERPHVDTQLLTDTGTYVYEAVATLEYAGRSPTRTAIRAAAGLEDQVLDAALAALTAQGLLLVTHADAEAQYVPARRDWSTAPDQAAGHPMS
jgi:hypothetical protein